MRRYAVILKRRQRNTITLRQLFNEWLPITHKLLLRVSLSLTILLLNTYPT